MLTVHVEVNLDGAPLSSEVGTKRVEREIARPRHEVRLDLGGCVEGLKSKSIIVSASINETE